jgi:anti-anti-sigma factor
VLDLSTTEHLDCSCLGVLIGKLHQWREHDPETQLRLIHVAPRLARMLSLANLDQLFILD